MLPQIVTQCGLAFFTTLGFGLLFNVPRRTLIGCGLTGVLGFIARQLMLNAGASLPAASFVGATTVALFGEIFAVMFGVSSTEFIVTGFVPLLPGVAGVRAMFQLLSGDYENGLANAVNVTINTAALAAGIGGLGAAARALRQHYEVLRLPAPPIG